MVIDTLYSTPAVHVTTWTMLPALEDGVPYWLTLAPGNSDVVAAWNCNVSDKSSTTIASITIKGWWVFGVERTRSAFQIEGRPRQAFSSRQVDLQQLVRVTNRPLDAERCEALHHRVELFVYVRERSAWPSAQDHVRSTFG